MEERQEANQTAERQPKRSLIDDLKGMSQEFDFSTMGTMGDFSAWGFGNTDDGSDDNNKLNEDNRWRGRSQERGSRGSDRDRDRDRDRGRRDGGRDYHRGRDGGGGFQRGNRDDDRGRNRRFGGREHSRNNDTPMKKGDWICRDCDFVNFASRTQCFKCNTSKDQRKSLPGGRSESGGNSSSYMGKRKSQDYSDEGHCEEDNDYGPPPEPEKRSKLDEDMFEAPMMTSWTDIKEFDDDHDAEMFTEENEYLTQRYGENVVRVRYTNKGLVGYYCMICDVEMTGEKPLDLHCRGMKHLKKKERRDNPEPFDPLPRIVNKDKKGGERDRPRLLPPEAFSRESGNDIGRSSDPHGGRSRSHSGSGGGQFGGSSGSGGNALQGSPTGALLSKLADCSVKSEGDAELATNVISLLLKSLKDYSMKKGESKVAELLLQAELKMSTIKALKVGLQYLAGGQGSGGGMDRMGGRGGMDRMGGGGGGMDRMSGGGGMDRMGGGGGMDRMSGGGGGMDRMGGGGGMDRMSGGGKMDRMGGGGMDRMGGGGGGMDRMGGGGNRMGGGGGMDRMGGGGGGGMDRMGGGGGGMDRMGGGGMDRMGSGGRMDRMGGGGMDRMGGGGMDRMGGGGMDRMGGGGGLDRMGGGMDRMGGPTRGSMGGSMGRHMDRNF